jgi:hypothetical protein
MFAAPAITDGSDQSYSFDGWIKYLEFAHHNIISLVGWKSEYDAG